VGYRVPGELFQNGFHRGRKDNTETGGKSEGLGIRVIPPPFQNTGKGEVFEAAFFINKTPVMKPAGEVFIQQTVNRPLKKLIVIPGERERSRCEKTNLYFHAGFLYEKIILARTGKFSERKVFKNKTYREVIFLFLYLIHFFK
jgi:hypothetical protein